ncbi:MAG: hypothetical protein J7578_03660 [Chitinophagaceae bacterium]|nr:hypothetical protein [Chitinophagaceae bacterium]
MMRLFRLSLPVLMMFGLASCLKEKSIDSTEDGGVGILRMKIDGKQWTANKTAVASIMNGYVTIMGSSQDNIDLMIQVQTGSAGTYQLDQASAHIAFVLDNNEATPLPYTTNQGANSSVAGGVVNITKIDAATKRISGSFTFKAYRSSDDKTLSITEGFFDNLPFTDGPPPTGTGNALSLKADGTDWTAPGVAATISGDDLLVVGSELNGNKQLSLTIPKDITPNTYVLDNTSFYVAVYQVGGKIYEAGTGGTLVITEHNTATRTIKGTFQFTAEDKGSPPGPNIAITSGSFSATY